MDTLDHMSMPVSEGGAEVSTYDEQEIERLRGVCDKLRLQRDDAIKICLMILEHSTPSSDKSGKHVHKYAVDCLNMLKHSIPYELKTKC